MFKEFTIEIKIHEEILHIVHVTASDMLQERDEETQTVIRILAQLDKKWNGLRTKVTKCALVNSRIKLRSTEDIEQGIFEDKVCLNGDFVCGTNLHC